MTRITRAFTFVLVSFVLVSSASAAQTVQLKNGESVTKVMKNNDCSFDKLAAVLRDSNIPFRKVRRLPVGTSVVLDACNVPVPDDVVTLSREMIDAERQNYRARITELSTKLETETARANDAEAHAAAAEDRVANAEARVNELAAQVQKLEVRVRELTEQQMQAVTESGERNSWALVGSISLGMLIVLVVLVTYFRLSPNVAKIPVTAERKNKWERKFVFKLNANHDNGLYVYDCPSCHVAFPLAQLTRHIENEHSNEGRIHVAETSDK